MNTRVHRWGNSLAIRIPKPVASELGLENNSEVELAYSEGKLTISPVIVTKYSLTDLISAINKSNLHKEVDAGSPKGSEVW